MTLANFPLFPASEIVGNFACWGSPKPVTSGQVDPKWSASHFIVAVLSLSLHSLVLNPPPPPIHGRSGSKEYIPATSRKEAQTEKSVKGKPLGGAPCVPLTDFSVCANRITATGNIKSFCKDSKVELICKK